MVATTTLQGLVPRERWDVDALYSTEAEPGMSYARFGAFLQVGMNPACSSLK
jgi:acyl transferase domain-containing protein